MLSFFFNHPFMTHILLLAADVGATIFVGWGIIWESPSQPKWRHRVATWFVIGGIAVETLCSICLFAFDEWISHSQQDKIIALEERITPRVVTDAERAAIRSLRGKVHAVAILPSADLEPAFFASQLEEEFHSAGINVEPVLSSPGDRWIGLQFCWPDNSNADGTALWKAFFAIEPDIVGRCDFNSTPQSVPENMPLLIIGDRKLFFPNGVPKSLRFRAYPGMAPKHKMATP